MFIRRDISQGEVKLKISSWSDKNSLKSEGMNRRGLENLMTDFRLINFEVTIRN